MGTTSVILAGGSIGSGGNSNAMAGGLNGSGSLGSSPFTYRTKFNAFTDPLIADQNGAGAWYGISSLYMVAGGQGSGGLAQIPANGMGGGGGSGHGLPASAGSFGCAGGAMSYSTNTVSIASGGYGSGASAASAATNSTTATAGAAICLIYQ
jgi:hypothetical protein